MKTVALYARVSSEKQEKEATVESQIAALTDRAKADGHIVLASDNYVDAGVSGSSLVRPALERLRDRVAEGGLDLLYLHSPDRLARRYAYQVLLLDEFTRAGVVVIFLNGATSHTAEDELLVQVQGVIAEYERAKIMERSRRGKLHKAKNGVVNVLSSAPYGYQYVRRSESEPARYQVLLNEAGVVRQVYRWFVEEQLAIRAISVRLTSQNVPTRKNRTRWGTSAVWNILRNPAYAGRAAYGKTECVAKHTMLRPARGRSGVSRKEKGSSRLRAAAEWLTIPVPAIVSEEVFAAAQAQLLRNARLGPRNGVAERYLLQGLVVCARCGYAFYGRTLSRPLKRSGQRPKYYRCGGSDGGRFGGKAVCQNAGVRVDQLDDHVWKSVREILQEPERVVEEWTRRGAEDGAVGDARKQRDEAERQLTTHQQALRRLQDAYEAGALTVAELTERSERVRVRIRRGEDELATARGNLAQTVELKALGGKLIAFAGQVRDGLDGPGWLARRQLIRTLVSKVEIDEEGATIVYRLPTPRPPGAPSVEPSPAGSSELCQLRSGRENAVVPGEMESRHRDEPPEPVEGSAAARTPWGSAGGAWSRHPLFAD